MGERSPYHFPTAALAWLGDAVYDLAFRRRLVGDGRRSAALLQAQLSRYVCAAAQARVTRVLLADGQLEEEARALLLRARNAKPGTMAKHADPVDYRLATALEALCGYYALQGDEGRLEALLERSYRILEADRRGARDSAEPCDICGSCDSGALCDSGVSER